MKNPFLHICQILPAVFGALLLMLPAAPASAAPSYWDLMKTPVRQSGTQIDIIVNTENFLPFGPPPDSDPDSAKVPVYGGGVTFGVHWHLGQWILGVESGVWAFFDMIYHDAYFPHPHEYYLMIPVYGVFGYQFNPASWFSITPLLGIGAASEYVKFEGAAAIPDGKWYGCQIFRFSTKFSFHITDWLALYLGISMNLSIQYPDVDLGPFSTVQLGAAFKIH